MWLSKYVLGSGMVDLTFSWSILSCKIKPEYLTPVTLNFTIACIVITVKPLKNYQSVRFSIGGNILVCF